MHFNVFSTAIAAGLLASQSAYAAPHAAVHKRDDSAIAKKLPAGMDLGKCDGANMFNTPENRKINWVGANGWNLVESFIDQNGVEMWGQNIFKTMFPQESAADFSCITSEASCSYSKNCNEFKDAGSPGMHYVLTSLKNVHTYFRQYAEDIGNMSTYLRVDMQKTFKDFGTDEKIDKPMDAMSILAAAMGAASAAAGIVPGGGPGKEAITTGLDTGSALLGFIKELRGEAEPEDVGKAAEEISKLMVDRMIIKGKEFVEDVRNAFFGVKGADQTKIPAAMKWNGGTGAGQDYHNAVTWALGDGLWLLDNPTEGLGGKFDNVRKQFLQMTAFQVMRIMKGAFVIIDMNSVNEKKCLKDKNAAWDAEKQLCYTIFHRDSKGGLLGGINDGASLLWESTDKGGYGMDRLATYKNTIECWESHNGAMGDADSGDMTTGLPKCAFGMEVKKGKFFEIGGDGYDGKNIKLDQDYPNFPNGEKHPAWPKTDCFNFGLACRIPDDKMIDAKFGS